MRYKHFLIAVLLWCTNCYVESAWALEAPKREFRGAWLHTINQPKYAQMNELQMQTYFTDLLDSLHAAGINAVLFQVRPQADAWYKSSLEPWSVFITGKQGKNPGWDPLAFMVEECHKRNMDIHAWINPYRVKFSFQESDFKEPFVRKHKQWILRYGNALWFDPGIPACQEHIVAVVRDIVKNYDVDGLHLDDYFYPYPLAGESFPDESSYAEYGAAQGYTGTAQKADWRRNNVNTLVRRIHETIREEKPWIRFGISPFGIHRNIHQDSDGSQTNGLSNYDDLYADALLWIKEGWIDYCIPQLYWEIGHTRADYKILIDWWGRHVGESALYIGQDILRTMKPKQLDEKMTLSRQTPHVQGNCFWPAYELENNAGHITDSLKNKYHAYPALLPADHIDCEDVPEPVYALDVRHDYQLGPHLSWKTVRSKSETKKAKYYVIYRFRKGFEQEDINRPENIIGITQNKYFAFPRHAYTGEWVYLVTAVNRLHQESPAERIVIRVNP